MMTFAIFYVSMSCFIGGYVGFTIACDELRAGKPYWYAVSMFMVATVATVVLWPVAAFQAMKMRFQR